MAHSTVTLPLLLLLSLIALTSTLAMAKGSSPSDFIKSSCRVTRYPALCIRTLSNYSTTTQQNPKKLAQAALTVCLSEARSAEAYVVRMSSSIGLQKREFQVMKDCVENMGDSVDRLGTSITELGHMGQVGEESFIWHISNVQTWVSAALTDEDTCMDGFAGRALDGKLKTAIRGRITRAARVTSNALALVNRFAERH